MASTLQLRSFSLFLILTILVSISTRISARDVPTKSKGEDKKQPEWFIEPDGSVSIPGIGRISVPIPGGHFNVPSNGGSSSPVVSSPGGDGTGSGLPGGDGTGSGLPGGDGTGSNLPGGDDTMPPVFAGFGTPVPAIGGAPPVVP